MKIIKAKNIKSIRLKVLLHKDQETIKPIPPAEDAEERHSTDNTKDADPAVIPKRKWEDVILFLIRKIICKKLDDGWACKTRRRRGERTGRMSYLKDVSRR